MNLQKLIKDKELICTPNITSFITKFELHSVFSQIIKYIRLFYKKGIKKVYFIKKIY